MAQQVFRNAWQDISPSAPRQLEEKHPGRMPLWKRAAAPTIYNPRMLGLLTAASMAAMAAAGYNSMAPRSQLFGRTFIGAGNGSRQLALTFDDGPNDPWTQRLLEVLDRQQVKATFFLIGRYVAQRPEIVRHIAQASHAIGNHTWDHPNLIFTRPREVESQIRRCAEAVEQAVGAHSKLFRPPYGGRTPQALRAVRRCGLLPVMWSVSGWDWEAESAAAIEEKVMGSVQGGDVILLHDGGHRGLGTDRSFTVSAVESLIPRCRDQGLEFVTVEEMMKGN